MVMQEYRGTGQVVVLPQLILPKGIKEQTDQKREDLGSHSRQG